MESNIYKKRLIIIIAFLVISILLSIPVKNSLIKAKINIEETIEFVETHDEEEVKKETQVSKEEALETLNKINDYYSFVDDNSDIILYTGLSIGLFGMLSGFMVYFIICGAVLKKYVPTLKSWMSWLLRIAVLIILLKVLYSPITIMGIIICIPNLIYTIYKYIKTKKEENKDDIITEN